MRLSYVFFSMLVSMTLVIMSSLTPLTAASASRAVQASPSADAGKTGSYHVKTQYAGNNYYVYCPSTYSDARPAGLHLFFHGQNGQKGASRFGLWKHSFLERFNLIGINMAYEDGNNLKNVATKVLAAREAIAQVMANYKILPGRGVICCYSGGGIPSEMFFYESVERPGVEWPFNHMALYSSNSRRRVHQKNPMSWSMSVGEKEWITATDMGVVQVGRFADVIEQVDRHADVYLNVVHGAGHKVHQEAVGKAAEIFARNDVSSSPMLYAPDYAEKELRKLVQMCNVTAFGAAKKELKKLLKKMKKKQAKKPDDTRIAELIAKLVVIESAVDARVDNIFSMLTGLATTDVTLFSFYAKRFQYSLKGYGKSEELQLKELVKGIDKMLMKQAQVAQAYLQKNIRSVFVGKSTPRISAEAANACGKISPQLLKTDHIRTLMESFLLYK